MTQKTVRMTANGIAKMPGWFSWRHQTRDAHDAAREQYISTRAKARARIRRRDRRAARNAEAAAS